jgi:iodotyrosine deiodinase
MTPQARYQPLAFETLDETEQHRRSEVFLARMHGRRTVRDFSSKPVPFALIQNAVATAGTAPSGANQQPWTFAVVGNPTIKRQIREAAETEEKENYARRMSDEWRDALAHLGTDWQKPHLEDAPYLIIVFAQSHGWQTDPATGQREKLKHYYVTESVGIAVGMLLASLHQAGLATLTHTPSPMKFLSEILGRPANERALVVIPVGYPAADAQVPVIEKKPLDEIMVVYE